MINDVICSRRTWVGFTIGLVATAALPFLVGTTVDILNGPRPERGARRIKAMADIFGIEQALDLFEKQHGRRPTAAEGLTALVPELLDKVPVDPWGNAYLYLPQVGRAHAVSYGADGKPGGEGAAADISRDDLFGERSANRPRQIVAIPETTARALLLGSALFIPLIAYLATDRPL